MCRSQDDSAAVTAGPSLSDCGCTFRLIHREALDRNLDDLTVGGSHFLPEMVILGCAGDSVSLRFP